MQALLLRELAVVEGCLRVNDGEAGTGHLLLWPPDFTWSIDNNTIQILSAAGQVVARVANGRCHLEQIYRSLPRYQAAIGPPVRR